MKKSSSHYLTSLLVAAVSPALISGSCTTAPTKAMGVATLTSTDSSSRTNGVESKNGALDVRVKHVSNDDSIDQSEKVHQKSGYEKAR